LWTPTRNTNSKSYQALTAKEANPPIGQGFTLPDTIGEGEEKRNVFTCVVEGYNGLVCGFFSSVDQGIKDHIPLLELPLLHNSTTS
jgi:hypothetical protein